MDTGNLENKINEENFEETVENKSDENTTEKKSDEKQETKKGSFFSKIGQGIGDIAKKAGSAIADTAKKVGSAINEKIEDVKEKNAENKALRSSFESRATKFEIVYKDTTKKNKEIFCIVDETNHILKTDFDLTLPNEVDHIQDSRKQGYYNLFIKSEKAKFTCPFNSKELSMDLYQIEYTNEKPKQEVPSTYIDNRVDNSINAGKGAIVGDHNSVDKDIDFNLGVNIPKK